MRKNDQGRRPVAEGPGLLWMGEGPLVDSSGSS